MTFDIPAARQVIAERREKAAESFMIAGLVREHDQDPSGWMLAGEQAAKNIAAEILRGPPVTALH
nr:hypothetical protein [uncultured Roseococcus sp.]